MGFFGGLSRLGVMRGDGRASLLVTRVRAVGILLDEGSALSNCGGGGVGEGVEEVVGF